MAANRGRSLSGAWNRQVNLLASIVVFVPILITWMLLWLASGSYEDYSATAVGRNSTFFGAWQKGFGGKGLSFQVDAAMVVAGIVCVLIVVVLAEWQASSRPDERDVLERLMSDPSGRLGTMESGGDAGNFGGRLSDTNGGRNERISRKADGEFVVAVKGMNALLVDLRSALGKQLAPGTQAAVERLLVESREVSTRLEGQLHDLEGAVRELVAQMAEVAVALKQRRV